MTKQIISVLIPTRNRPEYLHQSIEALLNLADDPDRVEILIGVDRDDRSIHDVQRIASNMLANEHSVLRIFNERYGYKRLHEYFNQLAKISHGDWIINWNDDTTMLTDRWDALLCDSDLDCVQFLRRDELKTADPTFPATARPIYEAMGHLSLNAHCDAWISDVSWWAKCQKSRNDIVFHHACLADQTAKERVDDMPYFKGTEQTKLRALDIDRVKKLLGRL